MTLKLAEIAAAINAHLKRFEADPVINATCPTYKTKPYWWTGAWSAGRYVSVKYVSYQGTCNLTKTQARTYLEWLDAGNVGKHWAALK